MREVTKRKKKRINAIVKYMGKEYFKNEICEITVSNIT